MYDTARDVIRAQGPTGDPGKRSTNRAGCANRRTSIVLAAVDAIASSGLQGLRASKVASEAGVTEWVVRRHFRDDSKLAAAILEYVVDQVIATIDAHGTASARRDRHLESVAELICERPALFLVFAELEVRGRRDARIRTATKRAERRWRAAAATLCDDDPEPGTKTADVIVAATKGVKFDGEAAAVVLGQLRRMLGREPGA